MGYYTSYSLHQERNPITPVQLVTEISGDAEANGAFEADGSCCESTKWYESDGFMRALSAKYPYTVFRLHGEGEEAGDIWDKYFVAGVMKHQERLNPELPKPDLDALMPVIETPLRRFKFRVVAEGVIEAATKEEAQAALENEYTSYDLLERALTTDAELI